MEMPADTTEPVREIIREIIVRARAGMTARDEEAPPESIQALIDEFEPLIDFLYNGP